MTTTHFTLVLDASGSMGSKRDSTRASIIQLIHDQKKITGDDCTLRIISFADNVVEIYNGPLENSVEQAIAANYIPGGSTALNDAVGFAIDSNGKFFDEGNKFDNVLLVVITDGGENVSKDYTTPQVKGMIEHQRDKYNWDIQYIGPEPDVAVHSYGVLRSATTNYVGAQSAIATTSTYLTRKRKGATA